MWFHSVLLIKGNVDLSAFNLDDNLTKLCRKQLQSMQEHIRPVHECKLSEESSKKRDDFVDATTIEFYAASAITIYHPFHLDP